MTTMPGLHTTLAAVAVAASLSAAVTAQQPPPSSPDDLRKLAATFDFVRGRNADDYAVSGPNAVDEAKYVKVGGIEQWITIRGEDRANPVVLLLHGGPGDATNPWGYAGLRPWLKAWTVVQWDQRGSARTLGRNGPRSADGLSIDRLVRDGVELADLLRTSLGKERITLVGHSFGSVLGVLMAKARPELFDAFVGTGQVGDPSRSYLVAYDALRAKAREAGDTRALQELDAIGPPPYKNGRGYQVQRRWSNLFEGADVFIAEMLGFGMSAPGYTMRDVGDWFDGQRLSAETLVPESSALPASALAGRFAVPVFVIQGNEDFTTPTSLARELVDRLEAPRKAFVTIRGGHFAVFMNPAEFLQQLNVLLKTPVP
jgi:pimeloyl-ACP methyl ester carboxylesterase